MTAPDAPTAMTLAEANEQALEAGSAIVPSGNGRLPWELARVGRTGARFYTWEEAASAVLGVPVVERDPTAELVEELRIIAEADPSKWDEDTRDQFREWAQNRARSALAKYRSEQ